MRHKEKRNGHEFCAGLHPGAGEGVERREQVWDAESWETPGGGCLLVRAFQTRKRAQGGWAAVPRCGTTLVPVTKARGQVCWREAGEERRVSLTLSSTLAGGDLQVCHPGDEPQESAEAAEGNGECARGWEPQGLASPGGKTGPSHCPPPDLLARPDPL